MSINDPVTGSIHRFLESMTRQATAVVGEATEKNEKKAPPPNMGPSSRGFAERDNVLKQILNILESQKSQDQKNRIIDTYVKQVTGSTGGFSGVTKFSKIIARLTGEPFNKGDAASSLQALRARISLSNLFQVILVSELCPTEYLNHPLAILAMQAKMGDEFEQKFAMLATHISLDLFLEDYNMLQDTLADLEYKILLSNFTSESDPAYTFADIGAGLEAAPGEDKAELKDILRLADVMQENANDEAGVIQILEERLSEEDTGPKKKDQESYFSTLATSVQSRIDEFTAWITSTTKKAEPSSLDINSSIENFLLKKSTSA